MVQVCVLSRRRLFLRQLKQGGLGTCGGGGASKDVLSDDEEGEAEDDEAEVDVDDEDKEDAEDVGSVEDGDDDHDDDDDEDDEEVDDDDDVADKEGNDGLRLTPLIAFAGSLVLSNKKLTSFQRKFLAP